MESMTDKTDRAAWSALAVMEEGAKVAREMQQIAERMLKGLPDQVNAGVQSGVKNSLKEVHSGLEEINKALTRGEELLAAQREQRRAYVVHMITYSVLLLLVGVVIGLAVYVGLDWTTGHLRRERDNLKAEIAEQEATLAELRTKTWEIELLTQEKDGQTEHWIVLPRGRKFGPVGTAGRSSAVQVLP